MQMNNCRVFGEKVDFIRLGKENAAKKIVILHGWDTNKSVKEGFMPLGDILSKKLKAEIIIPDLPGFGGSVIPNRKYVDSNYKNFSDEPQKAEEIMEEGWSVWDYSDWLEEFLNKLNLESPVLYGHSFGCRVILRFLLRNKDFAGKIILTSAAGIKLSLTIRQKISQFLAKNFSLAKKVIPRKIQKFIIKKIFGARDWGACPTSMKSTLKKVLAEPSIESELKNIKNSVLLIWGREDGVTPIESGRIFNKKIKNSHLKIIKNARHGIHRTHTQRIAQLVIDFLQK